MDNSRVELELELELELQLGLSPNNYKSYLLRRHED